MAQNAQWSQAEVEHLAAFLVKFWSSLKKSQKMLFVPSADVSAFWAGLSRTHGVPPRSKEDLRAVSLRILRGKKVLVTPS